MTEFPPRYFSEAVVDCSKLEKFFCSKQDWVFGLLGRVKYDIAQECRATVGFGCWLAGNDPEAVGLLDDENALGRAGCDVPLSSQETDLISHRDHPLVVNREMQV